MHTNLHLSPTSEGGGFKDYEIPRSSKHVTRDQLNLSPEATTAVIPTDTLRFVIPVPEMTGKPFRQPDLLPNGSANPDAGKPLVNWKGETIPGEGFVFFNYKDNCWQAVNTDGTGIIIFNGISDDSAAKLHGIVTSLVSHPRELTEAKLNNLLNVAAACGFGDRYNSDVTYAAGNLKQATDAPRSRDGEVVPHYGIHSRTKDICYALFIPGEGIAYQEGTASPQVSEENGLVVLIRKEGSTSAVQPSVFSTSYRLATGEVITDPGAQLKVQHPLLQQ